MDGPQQSLPQDGFLLDLVPKERAPKEMVWAVREKYMRPFRALAFDNNKSLATVQLGRRR